MNVSLKKPPNLSIQFIPFPIEGLFSVGLYVGLSSVGFYVGLFSVGLYVGPFSVGLYVGLFSVGVYVGPFSVGLYVGLFSVGLYVGLIYVGLNVGLFSVHLNVGLFNVDSSFTIAVELFYLSYDALCQILQYFLVSYKLAYLQNSYALSNRTLRIFVFSMNTCTLYTHDISVMMLHI